MDLKRMFRGGPPAGGPTGATRGDLNRQGHHGRPDGDLSRWAASRGLQFREGRPQLGYLLATCPWSEDVLFNVCRGEFAGGEEGVLCHEARLYEAGESGSFYGMAMENTDTGLTNALSFVLPVGSEGVFRVPYTVAGTRIAHLPAVRGLHVARKDERAMGDDTMLGTRRTRDLEDIGLRGWSAAVRKHSDEDVVDRILRGPVRAVLEHERALGFEIRLEYGQLTVSRQQFLDRNVDLDTLVGQVSELTAAVQPLCATGHSAAALAGRLPEAKWMESVRAEGGEHTMMPMLARMDMVADVAKARALDVEDAAAFHAAFSWLDTPGEAFAVLHGPLPGSGRQGRLVCGAERPMSLPENFRRILSDPGGPTGADTVVMPVDPAAKPTRPGGELVDGARLVVGDGALTLRRQRPNWQINGDALDALAAEAALVAGRRGL